MAFLLLITKEIISIGKKITNKPPKTAMSIYPVIILSKSTGKLIAELTINVIAVIINPISVIPNNISTTKQYLIDKKED